MGEKLRERKILARLPEMYLARAGNFLECTDRTTEMGRAVMDRIDSILADLGGSEDVTTVKYSQVRDFVCLDMLVSGFALDLMAGKAIDLGALTSVINCKTGVARMLGLERRAGKGEDLDSYLRRTAEAARARGAASSSNGSKPNGTKYEPSAVEGQT